MKFICLQCCTSGDETSLQRPEPPENMYEKPRHECMNAEQGWHLPVLVNVHRTPTQTDDCQLLCTCVHIMQYMPFKLPAELLGCSHTNLHSLLPV